MINNLGWQTRWPHFEPVVKVFLAAVGLLVVGYFAFGHGMDAAWGAGPDLDQAMLPVGVAFLALGSLVNLVATVWGIRIMIQAGKEWRLLKWWPLSMLITIVALCFVLASIYFTLAGE